MKVLLTLALALLASLGAAASTTPARHGTFGTHGMVLFGGSDGIYASHLPMFHAPHDYQVVLRLRLADPAQDAALRAQLDAITLWTINPEPFAIDRLAPASAAPLTAFKASVVLGHFEQGGVVQQASASFVVEQVLHFRQLSAQMHAAPLGRYLSIGKPERRYMVKLVDSRPDFDHIFVADTRPASARMLGTVYFSSEDLR